MLHSAVFGCVAFTNNALQFDFVDGKGSKSS